MPERDRNTHNETTPIRDGFKEGVMNDPIGVQYGIEVGHEKVINPAEIAKMTNEKSKRNEKQ